MHSAVLVSKYKTKVHVLSVGGFFSYKLELKQPMKEWNQDQPIITDKWRRSSIFIHLKSREMVSLNLSLIYSAYPLSGKLFWE